MAITRYGLTGPMTAYGAFQAKTAEATIAGFADLVCAIPSDDVVCALGSDDIVVCMPADDGGVTT